MNGQAMQEMDDEADETADAASSDAVPFPAKVTHAWGVLLGATDFDARNGDAGHGLAGIFMVDMQAKSQPVSTAILPNRKEARELANRVKSTWPRARAVRLRITIEVMD